MSDTNELAIVETDQKLAQAAQHTGLEKPVTSQLVAAFQPIYAKARTAIDAAKGVAEAVKDATCVTQIRKSRECRLAIRAVRIESEKTRKSQKEHAVLYGKAVDGFHNILMADLSPVENALQEAEDFAERAEAARLAQLRAVREAELKPFLDGPDAPFLSEMAALTEKQFADLLENYKLLRQAKLEAAAKAEAEAKAKAEAERLERERIAAENARLKAEAEAREAAAKAEREEAARKLAEERAAAEAARKLAEETARKEREAIEAKAKAERAQAEAARKLAEETARKEREAIEAKAKAERAAAEAEARQEREAIEAKARAERAAAFAEAKKEHDRLQAIADEERNKLAAAEAEAKRLRDAESKRAAEVAAAARKAAAAPDNAKAKAFAEHLRALDLPKFNTEAFDLLPSKIEALAKWVESQISTGELL